MSTEVATLISDAQELIGEVSGAGTQTYSEDIMLGHARRAFNLCFTKFGWPQYRGYFSSALDGATGKVSTVDLLVTVKSFEDILAVYRDQQTSQLPILPKNINPYTVTGTDVRYFTSLPYTDAAFATKLLQFWPLTSVGTVNIVARLNPIGTTFAADDTLDLDRDMLAYAMAFLMLSTDDINPGGAELYRVLMEDRFKSITAAMASQPIPISTGNAVPDNWFVNP